MENREQGRLLFSETRIEKGLMGNSVAEEELHKTPSLLVRLLELTGNQARLEGLKQRMLVKVEDGGCFNEQGVNENGQIQCIDLDRLCVLFEEEHTMMVLAEKVQIEAKASENDSDEDHQLGFAEFKQFASQLALQRTDRQLAKHFRKMCQTMHGADEEGVTLPELSIRST